MFSFLALEKYSNKIHIITNCLGIDKIDKSFENDLVIVADNVTSIIDKISIMKQNNNAKLLLCKRDIQFINDHYYNFDHHERVKFLEQQCISIFVTYTNWARFIFCSGAPPNVKDLKNHEIDLEFAIQNDSSLERYDGRFGYLVSMTKRNHNDKFGPHFMSLSPRENHYNIATFNNTGLEKLTEIEL